MNDEQFKELRTRLEEISTLLATNYVTDRYQRGKLLASNGISHARAAQLLGIDRSDLSKYVAGKTKKKNVKVKSNAATR